MKSPGSGRGRDPGTPERNEESGLFEKRGAIPAPPRSRLKIAHVAVADGLEDVELGVDCPSCHHSILLDVADVHVLGAALGWQPARGAPSSRGAEHAAAADARERHIESVMRTDVPAVPSETAIGLLPELFEKTGAACVVVVDGDGRPLAVASPLDLFREVGTHGPTSIAGIGLLDVAKTRVLYLRTDTRVSSALRLFAEQSPDYIVVVNDAGKLAGVVSPSDLLTFLTR